jgi:hypothetical protein
MTRLDFLSFKSHLYCSCAMLGFENVRPTATDRSNYLMCCEQSLVAVKTILKPNM